MMTAKFHVKGIKLSRFFCLDKIYIFYTYIAMENILLACSECGVMIYFHRNRSFSTLEARMLNLYTWFGAAHYNLN